MFVSVRIAGPSRAPARGSVRAAVPLCSSLAPTTARPSPRAGKRVGGRRPPVPGGVFGINLESANHTPGRPTVGRSGSEPLA